ncbi:unnamed protein product [Gongylonema pulchrum]|uniref:Uncharacterized protein n=1 Tax=Gongylonema pulchrum TaxID=637853 RepID=A0A183E7A8_9BILA|nr:unnamed protein product [Gongylonema pulchrum]
MKIVCSTERMFRAAPLFTNGRKALNEKGYRNRMRVMSHRSQNRVTTKAATPRWTAGSCPTEAAESNDKQTNTEQIWCATGLHRAEARVTTRRVSTFRFHWEHCQVQPDEPYLLIENPVSPRMPILSILHVD